ncbi:PD-(D/E)XK nuclease family protein [Desulfonatronovibrio magnus]|uniref:PD-(D/E)XK nuclease family protein n=1 Tax=Desulfonatronovibrio magnus TaxID=698827 RepID=UPI0005EBDD11|nr:DUF3782 domain-containing protein [Desulfonatronovibrio magnus]
MESTQNIKQIIKLELPKIMETDPEIHDFILRLTRKQYADRNQTDDRIERLFDELKRDREISQIRWEENQKELRELRLAQDKKWEENQKELRELRLAQDKKWEESQKKWEKSQKEFKELKLTQDKKWEENQKKWEENLKELREMVKSISKLSQRFDSSIGALGARWGLHSEASFRNGLKAILTESFSVRVERYEDYDMEGMVFGRPEQIELDVVIYNGDIIICEIKSSISKSEMHVFYRKKEYYEKKHDLKVNRTMVISPMIDPLALKVAERLGIETYSYADKVNL